MAAPTLSPRRAAAPVPPTRRWKRPSGFDIAVAVVGVAIAFLVLYPVLLILKTTIAPDGQLSGEAFREVIDDPSIGTVLGNTATIVLVSTTVAVLVACLFAWANERTDARIGWMGRILPLMALLIPGPAVAIGWLSLLSPRAGAINVILRGMLDGVGVHITDGPINLLTLSGLTWLYALLLMPIAYVVVQPAFQSLDPSIEEAARVSGAGLLLTLRRVTLPAILPALASAFVLTGVLAAAFFSVPIMLGGPAGIEVISTRVYRYLTATVPAQTGPAVVLALVVLVLTVAGVAAQQRLVRRGRHATIAGKRTQASLTPLGPWRWVIRGAMITYLLLSLVVPFAGLLYLSLQDFWSAKLHLVFDPVNFESLFSEGGQTRTSIVNSAVLGGLTATVATAAATLIAVSLHRKRNAAGRVVDGVAKLPATVSQLVLTVGLLVAFSGPPFMLGGSRLLLLMGFFILYLPLASFAANAATSQISNELVEAASINGARPGRTLRVIQLPLMAPTLFGGWILVFIATVGDITASALLATNETPVIGFRILDLQKVGNYPELAALGVVTTLASALVVTLSSFLINRRSKTS